MSREVVDHELPELGTVQIRALGMTAAMDYFAVTNEHPEQQLPLLIKKSVVRRITDDEGKESFEPVMNDEQWEDYGAAHLTEVMAVFNVASKVNGWDQEAMEEKPEAPASD